MIVWAVILYGSYRPVERILLLFSMVYLAYPVSAFMAHPDWRTVFRQSFVPHISHSSAYFVLVVGLIGTTITPWVQFYLQTSVVEKAITQRQYRMSRWDVIGGCLMTEVVTFFIVVACAATVYPNGIRDINDAADAAAALKPLAGGFASILFATGPVNPAILSAAILPLATTYNICEGLGFESGLNKKSSLGPGLLRNLHSAGLIWGGYRAHPTDAAHSADPALGRRMGFSSPLFCLHAETGESGRLEGRTTRIHAWRM